MLRLVGIDWAWTGHAVCVLDQTGTTVRAVGIPLGRRVPRPGRPAGPARRAGRAAGGDPTPDGGLRGPAAGGRPPGDAGPRRRDQGLAPGEVVWGANSDAGNATVIAQYPRLRRHRLRVPARLLAATRALRAAVGARGVLVRQRVAASNQLTATWRLLASRKAVLPTSNARSRSSSWRAIRP